MRRRSFLRLTIATAGSGMLQWSCATQPFVKSGPLAKVIIVGGGFAGASCALTLRRLSPACDVTLIDPVRRYVTCPMSNSVLVGLRGMQSITVPRAGLSRAGVKVIRDSVASIDSQRRVAHLDGGGSIPYDRLVLAAGIRFLWGSPQGYTREASDIMPHAWQAGVQTAILRRQLYDIPNGGVVGVSVPPGPMRCPPGPFERASLIAGFLRLHRPRCKILIFDSNNHFPKQDVFTEAWGALYPGMIEWIPVVEGGAVLRVAPFTRTFYTARGAHRVDVANVIPPQAPAMLAVQAGLAAARGWCPVRQDTFESTVIPNVHVIGDACIADPMPKSASAAHSQAQQCALAISAAFDGRAPPAPRFDSVCYSLLSRGRALAIHGRFRADDGVMEQMPQPDDPSTSPPQEADAAERWYRQIVHEAFGV